MKRDVRKAAAGKKPQPPADDAGRPLAYLDKIFCLEGEWSDDIRQELSVEPILKILKERGEIDYVHRRCGTRAELEHYLKRAGVFTECRVVYLAFHGARGRLMMSRDESVTLAELAAVAGGFFEGKFIYFGSCSTFKDADAELKAFLKKTRATAVAGYTKDVWWVESSAFELIFLYWAAYYKKPSYLIKQLARRYPQLEAYVGFKYYYLRKRGKGREPIVAPSPRWEYAEPACEG